ncbi:MAG: cell division initiation protein [Acidimicrobiaceae bacterium]
MDVTPQVINEVEFHQKMRGYDPDEVDDFLERVAVAVGQLLDRTREAAERAAIAERRAAELEAHVRSAPGRPVAAGPAPSPLDEDEEAETIRRTLVLAQRTADAAVKEAEELAARTLQSAQEQAQRVYDEAQEHARKLVVEAEGEARKTADGTRQRLVAEIITLEEARDGLRADHGILERHLDEQRLRLRSSIGDLQRLLDDPGRLRLASAPALSGVTRPDFIDEELEAAATPVAAPLVAGQPEPPESIIDLGREAPDALDPDDAPSTESRPTTGGVTFTAPDDRGPAPAAPASRLAVRDREEDAWARFAAPEGDDRPTAAIELGREDDDVYLTELRKAMLEDTSPSGAGGDDDDGGAASRPRARFGRRR